MDELIHTENTQVHYGFSLYCTHNFLPSLTNLSDQFSISIRTRALNVNWDIQEKEARSLDANNRSKTNILITLKSAQRGQALQGRQSSPQHPDLCQPAIK